MESEAVHLNIPWSSQLPLRSSPRKRGSIPCWPFLSGFFSTNTAQSWKIFWLTVFIKKIGWSEHSWGHCAVSGLLRARAHTRMQAHTHTVTAWVRGRNSPWTAYNCATYLQKKAVSLRTMKTWPYKSTKCKVAKVRWDYPWKKSFHHSIVHRKFTMN